MKRNVIAAAAVLAIVSACDLRAQATSQSRIKVRKEGPSGTASGVLAPNVDTNTTVSSTPMTMDTITIAPEWYTPSPTTCSGVDRAAAHAVAIKTDMFDPATMISPDTAKVIALCAVPGQIGSGEMNVADGRTHYA